MIGELKQFTEVRSGHPFRGSVPEVVDGLALAIQMRDLSVADGVAWEKVCRANLEGRKEPDWLQVGDILFVAKGSRNFAVCLESVPAPAVCSHYFFLIRVRDTKMLLPEFLAWQINQLPVQRYLSKNAEGTDQLSIRRAVLEATFISVPPMEQQRYVVHFAKLAGNERACLENLIHNREQQMQALALKLFEEN
jgi:hypothetical protein